MSEVQFDEENMFESKNNFSSRKKGSIASWLQKKGIVKDEKNAQYLLLGFSVICLVLAYLLTFGLPGSNSNVSRDKESLIKQVENSDMPENIKSRRINKINRRLN